MIAPPKTGWQTLVADLSIILFMVTAGALSHATPVPAPPSSAPCSGRRMQTMPPPARAEPLAVWREEPGGPALVEWLAAQPHDPRQQLTIVVRYRRGEEAAVAPRLTELFRTAARSGMRPRIVAEPGGTGITAGLAFDAGT